jgi:hypothetical protein
LVNAPPPVAVPLIVKVVAPVLTSIVPVPALRVKLRLLLTFPPV